MDTSQNSFWDSEGLNKLVSEKRGRENRVNCAEKALRDYAGQDTVMLVEDGRTALIPLVISERTYAKLLRDPAELNKHLEKIYNAHIDRNLVEPEEAKLNFLIVATNKFDIDQCALRRSRLHDLKAAYKHPSYLYLRRERREFLMKIDEFYDKAVCPKSGNTIDPKDVFLAYSALPPVTLDDLDTVLHDRWFEVMRSYFLEKEITEIYENYLQTSTPCQASIAA